MKVGVKDFKKAYKKVNIDDIEVCAICKNKLYFSYTESSSHFILGHDCWHLYGLTVIGKS